MKTVKVVLFGNNNSAKGAVRALTSHLPKCSQLSFFFFFFPYVKWNFFLFECQLQEVPLREA